MEPVAHFGLGKNKNVIKVIVEWPDGNKKEILNPLTNKTIKVLYWYLKSQIINVLLGPKDLGIHALPIHDAVVVGKAWVDMSKELMEQVFLDMTNVESWVQVD